MDFSDLLNVFLERDNKKHGLQKLFLTFVSKLKSPCYSMQEMVQMESISLSSSMFQAVP
jgi:hypothetical protein